MTTNQSLMNERYTEEESEWVCERVLKGLEQVYEGKGQRAEEFFAELKNTITGWINMM